MNEERFEISIDLETARRSAARIEAHLQDIRRKFDLSGYEYCKKVRIAPGEISRSGAVITLATWFAGEDSVLSVYLHEQIHWYVFWFVRQNPEKYAELRGELGEIYPAVPVGKPDSGYSKESTYLHLIVNWLEIEATARFLGRERAVAGALEFPVYKWIYRTVVEDHGRLERLFEKYDLSTPRPATDFTPAELSELAATAAMVEAKRAAKGEGS